MIWLAIVTETEEEYHIRFEGHDSVESAKNEMSTITGRLLSDGKLPLPYYVYEADEPLHGHVAHHLDDIDFNFYRDRTAEEEAFIKKTTRDIEHAIATGDEDKVLETIEKAKASAKP
jgi:hypothetical protein